MKRPQDGEDGKSAKDGGAGGKGGQAKGLPDDLREIIRGLSVGPQWFDQDPVVFTKEGSPHTLTRDTVAIIEPGAEVRCNGYRSFVFAGDVAYWSEDGGMGLLAEFRSMLDCQSRRRLDRARRRKAQRKRWLAGKGGKRWRGGRR